MGRFTDREKHEQGIWVDEQNELYDFHKLVEPSDVLYPAINKLAHYEDMEEQGRLIELPCKKVYRIINFDSPKYAFIDSIPIEMMPICELKRIDTGSVFFSTKEEAEAKLKELEGDNK